MVRMTCKYCGKNSPTEYCNEFCKNEYERYMDNVSRNTKWFTLGFLTAVILCFVGVFTEYVLFIVGIGILIIGFVFVLFPFATPQTVDVIGVRRSVKLVYITGIVFLLLGILSILCGFFI